jgi:beta-N-acetylhexosaminidase
MGVGLMIDLKGNPFFLNDESIQWVNETLDGMNVKDKVGQLFCEIVWDKPGMDVDSLFSLIEPGGIMFRPDSGKNIQKSIRYLQEKSKIPMLIAGNLERGGSGGNGGLTDGTYYGSPMQVAATDDGDCGYKLGQIACREGAAVGINWTFEPIIDIDYNYNNPITNVRTFGSDLEKILKMAKGYMKGAYENGLAVAIKHFPGDGVDFRDQHLLASINSMSVEEWDNTYGWLYKQMIEAGANTLMSAHIKLPAYSKKLNPELKDEEIMPSSLSYELNQKLIREQLGFNGLIVTDATQMAGFTVSMERELAVPTAIAAGCDMFLFTVNHKEDVDYMFKGIENGIISEKRLDEAVTRILALKASLKLHEKQENGTLVPDESALGVLKCEEHIEWARECADKAITLVKDKKGQIPLSPEKQKNILLCVITNEKTDENGYTPEAYKFKNGLKEAGFYVDDFRAEQMPGGLKGNINIKELKEKYELLLYYVNMRVASNQTSVRITWSDFLGEDAPKYVKDLPAVFISASNPYHLLDVPMVSTYINAYSSNEFIVEALVEKLTGKSEFKGKNPVDPFCGLWDTRL